MNTKSACILAILLVAASLLTSCGAGQPFGPALTLTPTATETLVPTATFTVTPTASITPAPTASDTPTIAPTSDTVSPAGEVDGLTLKTAIIIEADDEFSGILKENEWLQEHYPGYEKGGQATTFDGDIIYDIISITTADGIELKIYFDITAFYGKL